MKILVLIAALLVGSVVTANAMTSTASWRRTSPGVYRCSGDTSYVVCRQGEVVVTFGPTLVALWNGDTLVALCAKAQRIDADALVPGGCR